MAAISNIRGLIPLICGSRQAAGGDFVEVLNAVIVGRISSRAEHSRRSGFDLVRGGFITVST